MTVIYYEQLKSFTNKDLDLTLCDREDFEIVAPIKIGYHIEKFVKCDEEYRSRHQNVVAKLRYLRALWHGLNILPFIQLWNRAYLEGYQIVEISHRDVLSRIGFARV